MCRVALSTGPGVLSLNLLRTPFDRPLHEHDRDDIGRPLSKGSQQVPQQVPGVFIGTFIWLKNKTVVRSLEWLNARMTEHQND